LSLKSSHFNPLSGQKNSFGYADFRERLLRKIYILIQKRLFCSVSIYLGSTATVDKKHLQDFECRGQLLAFSWPLF